MFSRMISAHLLAVSSLLLLSVNTAKAASVTINDKGPASCADAASLWQAGFAGGVFFPDTGRRGGVTISGVSGCRGVVSGSPQWFGDNDAGTLRYTINYSATVSGTYNDGEEPAFMPSEFAVGELRINRSFRRLTEAEVANYQNRARATNIILNVLARVQNRVCFTPVGAVICSAAFSNNDIPPGAGEITRTYIDLANDPPRTDYDQTFEYSDGALNRPDQSGSVADFFATFFAVESFLLETLLGTLVSTERFLGAVQDGDIEASLVQSDLAANYFSSISQGEHDYGVFIGALPQVFSEFGFTADDFDVEDILAGNDLGLAQDLSSFMLLEVLSEFFQSEGFADPDIVTVTLEASVPGMSEVPLPAAAPLMLFGLAIGWALKKVGNGAGSFA